MSCTMLERFAPVLVGAACLVTAPADAQIAAQIPAQAPPAAQPAPTMVAPVTIEAAAKPKVVQKQTQTFVQSYAAAPNTDVDQIGRWRDPICVQVEGLPLPAQAAAIKGRVEDVAKAVGLNVAKPGCRSNIQIVFTDQPQRLMDAIADRHEEVLGYYHRHERARLKTVTRPIQSWYVTATKGEGDGRGALMSQAHAGPSATPPYQFETEVVDDPDNQPPMSCGSNPHFSACLQTVFHNVLVVADSKAMQGKDLGLVADYLVMLTMSQPRSLDGCNALPSVIDVFAKSPCANRDAPDGLTPSDAAYLTALYGADLRLKKSGEQEDIALRMARILIKANAAAH